jgi:hypothetical protein
MDEPEYFYREDQCGMKYLNLLLKTRLINVICLLLIENSVGDKQMQTG